MIGPDRDGSFWLSVRRRYADFSKRPRPGYATRRIDAMLQHICVTAGARHISSAVTVIVSHSETDVARFFPPSTAGSSLSSSSSSLHLTLNRDRSIVAKFHSGETRENRVHRIAVFGAKCATRTRVRSVKIVAIFKEKKNAISLRDIRNKYSVDPSDHRVRCHRRY